MFISQSELEQKLEQFDTGTLPTTDAPYTDPSTTDCEEEQIWYYDYDGDGYGDPETFERACEQPDRYVSNAEDCNDSNAAVHPTLWYKDDDGDGYGNQYSYQELCEEETPEGYVSGSLGVFDCDDGREEIHPGALELCDGNYDEDCDGQTNEAGADGCDDYVLDADGDGYGAEDGVAECLCEQPTGWVESTDEELDCDDEDEARYPGAIEICGDGIDNDCVEVDPSCPLDEDMALEERAVLLSGDVQAGALGSALAIGDLLSAKVPSLVATMPGGASSDGDERAVVVYETPLGPFAEPALTLTGFEASSLIIGDLDDDGDDLLVGAEGDVYVLFGPLSAADSEALDDAASFSIEGNHSSFGAAMTAVFSDGDPLVLAIGAPDVDGGEVSLVFGELTEDSVVGATVDGVTTGDRLGAALDWLPDPTGEGMPYGVVAAPGATIDDVDNAGAVYLIPGDGSLTDLADVPPAISGTEDDEAVGSAVRAAGDIDGDGLDDLWVLVPTNDEGFGTISLIRGDDGGDWEVGWAVISLDKQDDLSGLTLTTGEVDGDPDDGRLDLLIGVPTEGDGGVVHVLPSSVLEEGPLDLADEAFELRGGDLAGGDHLSVGAALAVGADLDNDGFDDVCIGAPGLDLTGGDPVDQVGAIYLLFGGGE